MKIFLLSPIYATTTKGSGATPVVHYFAKEWVKLGHEVHVYNLQPKYPRPYYWFSKIFHHTLNTKLGILLPTTCPKDDVFIADGVDVHRVTISKFKPHGLYSKKQIDHALSLIKEGCSNYGVPDIFIGHWHNPQLQILVELKHQYGKKICLVLHNNYFKFDDYYGPLGLTLLKQIDVIGFRSIVAKNKFIEQYWEPRHSFIAYSGVSDSFIKAGFSFSPSFVEPINKFAFVGSLIARKYPAHVLDALIKCYPDNEFRIKYIGDGAEMTNIKKLASSHNCAKSVEFTGRIPRESIISHLKECQCFVMISTQEIFGLVYLEAMSLGLIPIGSKKEGIDGIIQDGVNGFLCEAGNVQELSSIIRRIQNLSKEELITISNAAKRTALDFTDDKVAETYLNSLF